MDLTIDATWLFLAIFLITVIIIKNANARVISDPGCTRPPPPVVNIIALLKLLPTLCTKGPEVTMTYLYNRLGSVFTISFLWKRISFLVGPEVSGLFFQGSESEVSQGNTNEFTVPMFGLENGYAVDYSTRVQESRFFIDALKPSQLRSHVDPMLREVEDYFAKWGEEGVVDLKDELNQILMLLASRCLLANEVREKLFGELYTLFSGIEEGVNLVSYMLPYIPISANHRRDKARIRLTEILYDIMRSRKTCVCVEEDVLQKIMLTSKLSHICKDPEVFDPYRFHPGREEDKVGGKFSYSIFGGGSHVCLGEAYAFMQIKIIWSHLLRNFELKLTSPFPKTDWSKFVLEPKGKVLENYKRHRLESN